MASASPTDVYSHLAALSALVAPHSSPPSHSTTDDPLGLFATGTAAEHAGSGPALHLSPHPPTLPAQLQHALSASPPTHTHNQAQPLPPPPASLALPFVPPPPQPQPQPQPQPGASRSPVEAGAALPPTSASAAASTSASAAVSTTTSPPSTTPSLPPATQRSPSSGPARTDTDRASTRKERNRLAAQKSRDKKQAHVELLEKENAELKAENRRLREAVGRLERMVKADGRAVGGEGQGEGEGEG
ncbi:hypothetical protein JCM10207_003483 [Rhodosporidiobolus poonsookiae]